MSLEALPSRPDFAPKVETQPFPVAEVLVAGNRGPCGGVNMALEVAHEVLLAVNGREPVYTTNPVVHYKEVVDTFREMGLKEVPTVGDIPEGAIVLLSAHGNTPQDKETLAKNGCVTVDTTCQLVKKVQNQARRAIEDGKDVVYFGSFRGSGEMHPETRSILGHAEDEIARLNAKGEKVVGSITLVTSPGDIDRIDPGDRTIVGLSQTTMSTLDTRDVHERAREKFGDSYDATQKSICHATDNRQNALIQHAEDVDGIIVVGDTTGDRPSHNTTMLAEIGAQHHPTHAIGSESQLDGIDFSGMKKILLTSGASVPDDAAPIRALNWFSDRGAKITYLDPDYNEHTAAFTKPVRELANLRATMEARYGNTPAAN